MWFNTVRQNAVLADRLGNLKKIALLYFLAALYYFGG
jgi:hypothetical protein